MERLTIRLEHGHAILEDGCHAARQNAVQRLAAYEDTGLEPEQVTELKGFIQGGVHKVDDGWAHVQELLQAEQEGRLVVLPCKVEQTVYKLSHYHDCADNLYETCDLFAYDDSACNRCYKDKLVPHVRPTGFELAMLEDFGKTVFLTREEAEKALRGGGSNEDR